MTTTFRIVIVAGLIASVSVAGICPCEARTPDKTPRHMTHSPGAKDACDCVLKMGRCLCGTTCKCSEHRPQNKDEPAIPNRFNDRSDALMLIAETTAYVIDVIVESQNYLSLPLLSPCNQSLVAQGTRLNC